MRERESIGIPLLRDGDRVISSNSGKANVLNSYFKSVFTAEVTLTIPSKDSSPFPDIADNFPLLLLYESRGGSSDFQLPTSNFRLPTSNFRSNEVKSSQVNLYLNTVKSIRNLKN